MSMSGLLTQTAQVFARGPGVIRDKYNQPVEELAEEAVEYPAYLEPTAGRELLVSRTALDGAPGRQTVIADHLIVIGRNVEGNLPNLDATDRIDVDGRSFEVLGPPAPFHRPRQGPHHVEAILRVITG
jgi:hypothetical protein